MGYYDCMTEINTNTEITKEKRINNVLWFITSFICVILSLRFVFLLLGANDVGLAKFLFDLTDVFIAPFSGIFDTPQFGEYFFSSASILAVVMYLLICVGITKVVTLIITKGERSE